MNKSYLKILVFIALWPALTVLVVYLSILMILDDTYSANISDVNLWGGIPYLFSSAMTTAFMLLFVIFAHEEQFDSWGMRIAIGCLALLFAQFILDALFDKDFSNRIVPPDRLQAIAEENLCIKQNILDRIGPDNAEEDRRPVIWDNIAGYKSTCRWNAAKRHNDEVRAQQVTSQLSTLSK
ncbi:hypothetical protein [Carnimonas bestiolae]|uniref:hypothetical protein n=1 Tax=Carnimonas bestiolae TaxID=3402172 RepID=UPI003EDBDABF